MLWLHIVFKKLEVPVSSRNIIHVRRVPHLDRSLTLIPLLPILGLASCASPIGTVSHFEGRGWHSFQSEDYRVYVMVPQPELDSCEALTYLLDLLSEGILRGHHFHVAIRIDTNDVVCFLAGRAGQDSVNRWYPKKTEYSTTNYNDVNDDLGNFRGRPVFIEFASVAVHHIGTSRDTIDISMSADLTGHFPGPMGIYRISFSFDSSHGECSIPLANPTLERFRFEGWIL